MQTTIRNAMSVDVEDYFHVSAFSSRIDREEWEKWPCRVEASTETVLRLLVENGASGTFFILGWIAERYPGLVRRIAAEAMADPRTVTKYLRGEHIRGVLVRERIARALAERGIVDPQMERRAA